MITFDNTIHATELLIIAKAAWHVIKASKRAERASGAFEQITKDFPLHRHVGNEIIFPDGYEPTKPGHLRERTA